MADADDFRAIALSLPDVVEQPHFEKTSFRVLKKIFATMDYDGGRAMVKLSLTDQHFYCMINHKVIYPVPNKWGLGGATYLNLSAIDIHLLAELLKCAYKNAAPANKTP